MSIDDLTEKAIGCAFEVHNCLGSGFLEKVYENALSLELREAGLSVAQQVPMPVSYKGATVGDYIADLVVDGRLGLEIKAVRTLQREHEVQLVNYLTASGVDHGLLLNFGESVEVRRKFRVYKPSSRHA